MAPIEVAAPLALLALLISLHAVASTNRITGERTRAVLEVLQFCGECTLATVADRAHCPPSLAHALLQRLEQRGLVRSAQKRGARLYSLTDAGALELRC